jgi:malate dehydrogenase (oxaloacetate-decarboxylating)
MDYKARSIELHKEKRGKLEVVSRVAVGTKDDLSLAYTPGVAAPCLEIADDVTKAKKMTSSKNTVAVISDGSAVLGLGNIGPQASLPVMEGKCVLFKEFAGVDAFPIVLDTQDVDEIVQTIKMIAPTFGGINLEDISAPRCLEIERRLIKELDIPVFHDDQHGTAIVVLAGLINALKLVDKTKEGVRIVVNGSGAAGIAITRLLHDYGFAHLMVCDSRGIISRGRDNLNYAKEELLEFTNLENRTGDIHEAIKGADIFIGVSAPDTLKAEDIKNMNEQAIVFAMANPVPEIMPDIASEAGAAIVATGRSDFANQLNNVLVFPGIFKGAFEAGATAFTNDIKFAAAEGLAALVAEPTTDKIIPDPFEPGVADAIAQAVIEKIKK